MSGIIERVTLPSGRQLVSTGKVVIGIAHQPQPHRRDPGTQAEIIQRVLCTPLPREWHEHPRAFQPSRPWWRRALALVAAAS